jgi:hypothetical protein
VARRGKAVFRFFIHLNRRAGAPLRAAAFIALVNDEPSLSIADYHEFHGKLCFEESANRS